MVSPEAKIRFFGKEVDPGNFALVGAFLILAGIWAGNAPCIAIPAIIVGTGMMVHGTNKMGKHN